MPVQTVSFADAMERVTPPVSLVKIDCEGAEYDIVGRSPAKCLGPGPDGSSSSTHPPRQRKSQAFRDRLTGFGFNVIKERRTG